jgi:putative endonuclease
VTDSEIDARHALGQRAEQAVAGKLEAEGFAVLARNERLGHLELDIVARRDELLVVCEVRARTDDEWISPVHTVGAKKLTRVRRAAGLWLRKHQLLGRVDVRIDVASVVVVGDALRIEYYEGVM